MKVAVLISGRGSNLQSLIDARAAGELDVEMAAVISNVPDAQGLERAKKAEIPTIVIDHREFADREAFEDRLDAALREVGAELICLAGFMRLLTDAFCAKWMDRLINIHPSLLPAFKGLHTHERVLDSGVRITGATVHFVRPAMDDGPIIVQAAVPVLSGDTADDLAARVLAQEHRIYPIAVRLIAEGRVSVRGDRVTIDDPRGPESALINPMG